MSDMIACLNDLSYIPPNNEQNESTQGDIGKTSNEPTQAIRNEFKELYASANEELLQRLYKSSHTAKKMTWHATRKCTNPGKMQHPVDGRAWKKFDTRYPDFTAEPRNVRLGLAADGFNPFGNLSQSYNMWHVILTTYNFPPWLCMKESYLMLTLLIHGPKSRGKDIDVYLRPLIDDLMDLWALKGVETIDVATGQKFNMRAMQYLPSSVATAIIELCSFFKQICFGTLMEADMVKAQSKVIDILCNLKLIYPPAFFDIMIHLVIHLPLEALEGMPILPEGYVAEEALTFSSYYFWDVTTKFNRSDRNVDCPPLTCMFQVFQSTCKSIGKRSVIRLDHQELKKVIWYVLHNRAKFKSQFPNQDMKEEFPGWFGSHIRQCYIDKDPGVSESDELFALACRPTLSPISVNSCVVNGVRFVVHSLDERRTTQNNGICSPGEKDGEMYYGQLEEILEFSYMSFKVVLF
ncbi:reverse transcriptase domain-containing protein [Tanacetum coccineum]